MMLIIVMSVLKTEFMPQIVSVQMELMIVVLPLVAHVISINVSLVKENGIIVLNVMISESLPQLVIAHQVTMKKMIIDVKFVLKNVSLVLPMLTTVSPVEESEKMLQIVTVHLDIIKD